MSGPREPVNDFADRIAKVENRRVAGVTTKQMVPFSFDSMWVMARMKGESPGEAFDMTRWGPVRRGRGAEVRYRFHTRSLELHPLLKRLSKHVPGLTFALVTMCLDDSDFGAFTIANGRLRGKWLGDDWRMPFWERAAKKFNMPLDETWEDPDTEVIAESWMRDAAMRIATGSDRDYRWTGGTVYRDFEDERATAMLEFAQAIRSLDEQDAEKPRTRPKRRTRSKKR